MNVQVKFKGSWTMYFVACYLSLTSSCKMSWHYFGTWHGKGEWDGASPILKRALRIKKLHNPQRRFQDVANVLQFLKKGMVSWAPNTYKGNGSFITRHFWKMKPTYVDRSIVHSWITKVALHIWYFFLLTQQFINEVFVMFLRPLYWSRLGEMWGNVTCPIVAAYKAST
jgi:hypothetical protein